MITYIAEEELLEKASVNDLGCMERQRLTSDEPEIESLNKFVKEFRNDIRLELEGISQIKW